MASADAALFARAYGDPELLANLQEEGETNIKSIRSAMIEVAPAWAAMREAAAKGDIAEEMDTTEQLVAAVRIVQRARQEGRQVADVLSSASVDPITENFLALMFRDTVEWKAPTSHDNMVLGLQTYVDEALKTTAGVDIETTRGKQYAEEKRKQEQQELPKGAKRAGEGREGAGRGRGERGAQAAEDQAGRGDREPRRALAERADARGLERAANLPPKGLEASETSRSGESYYRRDRLRHAARSRDAQDPHEAAREMAARR